MTVNQSFQNWTIISDEPGEQFIFEHDETGERVSLSEDGSVSTPSVSTDSITDATDGQPWETLREAGWATGNNVPTISFGVGETRSLSTTISSGWKSAFSVQQLFLTWDDIAPTNGVLDVFFGAQLVVGSGETVTAELFNNTDGEVITSIQSSSDGLNNLDTGWVSYEPTTTDATIEIFPRFKTEPGQNSSQFNAPTTMFGVEL